MGVLIVRKYCLKQERYTFHETANKNMLVISS